MACLRIELFTKAREHHTPTYKIRLNNGVWHVINEYTRERVTFTSNVPEMHMFDSYGNVIGHPKFTIINGITTNVERARS